MDLQKAYDTVSVSHGLFLARLEAIGVGPKMLAAINSLYSTGALCTKIHSSAGHSQIQQNGVRQNCPLSPTLFGIFFDGPQAHLDGYAPHADLQLDSGCWGSSLVYADDDALMSWTSHVLQSLFDGMHVFWEGLGLTLSSTK